MYVRILKDFTDLNLFRQTPGGLGIWEDITFSEQPTRESDYVLVLNKPFQDATVRCPTEHVWAIMQEPPNEMFGWMHRGDPSYARVYTTDANLPGNQCYRHTQPALAWHVEKDYDFLSRCAAPEKRRALSWVTSNKSVFQGHRARLRFLEGLQNRVEFDLFGLGYRRIADKWDALSPYRYSLAIENFSNAYYWSEKLADCFLAWAMPIYYGCTRITDYFPPEAMVIIDIHDPQATEQVREAVRSDAWRRNREAIAYARQLALDRYQLFPFIAQEIRAAEAAAPQPVSQPQEIFIPAIPRVPLGRLGRLQRLWRRVTPTRLRAMLGRARQLLE